jgi:hypothetical protein
VEGGERRRRKRRRTEEGQRRMNQEILAELHRTLRPNVTLLLLGDLTAVVKHSKVNPYKQPQAAPE